MMQENILEVTEFVTTGFKPLISFDKCRVATLCYVDDLYPVDIASMERHLETDEVFVLLNGKATLMLGGAESAVRSVKAVSLEPMKAYNVKRNAWHGMIMSRDAVILLVENDDTGSANSEYFPLTSALKQIYLSEARTFADWQRL
jgi:ureidoglycolate hydrolase